MNHHEQRQAKYSGDDVTHAWSIYSSGPRSPPSRPMGCGLLPVKVATASRWRSARAKETIAMSQPNLPGAAAPATNLQLTGGAAIVAPVSAFPGGVPGERTGRSAPQQAQGRAHRGASRRARSRSKSSKMWELLGFNGPAVQVQDAEGRPIAIGLEDLLSGLDKHWQDDSSDLNRGRIFAQELMKYGRFEKAEKVMAKVVALGRHRRGLARPRHRAAAAGKVGQGRGARSRVRRTCSPRTPSRRCTWPRCTRARRTWPRSGRWSKTPSPSTRTASTPGPTSTPTSATSENEEAAIKAVGALADAEPNKRSAAPYVALQGVYSAKEETPRQGARLRQESRRAQRERPLALICLSALYGQKGDLDSVIALLSKHEAKMTSDVRLANNYFEALFQRVRSTRSPSSSTRWPARRTARSSSSRSSARRRCASTCSSSRRSSAGAQALTAPYMISRAPWA